MGKLKRGVYRAVSRLHAALFPACPGPGLRVLLYHSVGPPLPRDPYGLALDPADFRRHADWLAGRPEGWEPSPLEPPRPGRKAVAITFDDGFEDTLRRAAPVLVERKLPFTVFVTAAYLRERRAPYLSPERLKELAALPGASIGAHGDAHESLTALDGARLRRELEDSRKYLQDLLGRTVASLSYPHGDVDRRVRDAAEAAGYALGCCSRYGLNGPARDPLLLCRTELTAWDGLDELRLKTLGHWDWFRFRRRDPGARSGGGPSA